MIWTVAALIALVNLPFGFWRAGLRKFSPAWFVAVHAPVPLAIALRFATGLGFQWRTLPIYVAAFFGGQWLGGRLRGRRDFAASRKVARSGGSRSADEWRSGDLQTTAETKAEWRERLRARLAEIEPAAAVAAADRVAESVLALPEVSGARGILTCLSFGAEIDTWRLVDRLVAAGKELFVPRADPRDGRLHVHPYPCPLRTLAFGLRQPPRGAPELAAQEVDGAVEAALVLGLGFDRRGFRLGYGSGYFDRFLAGRPFPAIALAFAVQLEDELPAEPHDIPMTVIVTENEICR